LVTVAEVAAPETIYDKKNPFPAEVLENINLNGAGSAKETRHVEISLEGSGLHYDAGDALGVYPLNSDSDVQAIIKAGNWKTDEIVPLPDEGEAPLVTALTEAYDITGLSKVLFKKYATEQGSPEILKLLEDKEGLENWLWGRQWVDLLEQFPIKGFKAKDFVAMLRKLSPRLYSIASSIHAHPEEVHLTVGAVRYHAHGKDRTGVCSTYLADRIGEEDKVKVFLHHNKNFKLPESGDTPIIMVGPGTGIAPFRSFIEERIALGAKGKNWLFFGDQHFDSDFLYQLEWQQYLKDGSLTQLDVAFSRDTKEKVYVQHRMMEKSKEIWSWIQEGAHFYVCGDASRMAKDVHSALIEIANKEGGMSPEDAEVFVKQLQKDKRYQRDVY
jgi:sulfite reductase (NADPH) flavoprotein alpha-component